MSDLVMEATGIAKDLGHGAGQIRALKGVDLALKGGQLTLLMGPSGSGKTTLLSILGCMLTPTEGTVRVRGDSIAGKDPEDLAKLRGREHRLRVPVLSPVSDALRRRQREAGARRPWRDRQGRGG